jgi:hypothetical protein
MLAPKFMNEILYNQKNFLKSQENFLSDLKPYMLVPEVWEKLCAQQPSIDVAVPNNNNNKPTSFKPGLRDSVFWCMYVAIHGESCYQSHIKSGTNMINLMMNEKKAISDHFNNNSTLLKSSNQKLTLAKINEIKCNLMTKPVMDSVESFIPCSIYYGRPIYVYFEEIHSYLKFADKNYVSDNDNTDNDNTDKDENNDIHYDPNVILIMVKDQKTILETNVSTFMKNKDSLFHIQHYDKILSGVSNYKTDEIREIYKKVFGEDADLKKPEYYEKVLVKISLIIKNI